MDKGAPGFDAASQNNRISQRSAESMEDYFSPNINDTSGSQDAGKNALCSSGNSADACISGGDCAGCNAGSRVSNCVQG
jgi:hypothetical protein